MQKLSAEDIQEGIIEILEKNSDTKDFKVTKSHTQNNIFVDIRIKGKKKFEHFAEIPKSGGTLKLKKEYIIENEKEKWGSQGRDGFLSRTDISDMSSLENILVQAAIRFYHRDKYVIKTGGKFITSNRGSKGVTVKYIRYIVEGIEKKGESATEKLGVKAGKVTRLNYLASKGDDYQETRERSEKVSDKENIYFFHNLGDDISKRVIEEINQKVSGDLEIIRWCSDTKQKAWSDFVDWFEKDQENLLGVASSEVEKVKEYLDGIVDDFKQYFDKDNPKYLTFDQLSSGRDSKDNIIKRLNENILMSVGSSKSQSRIKKYETPQPPSNKRKDKEKYDRSIGVANEKGFQDGDMIISKENNKLESFEKITKSEFEKISQEFSAQIIYFKNRDFTEKTDFFGNNDAYRTHLIKLTSILDNTCFIPDADLKESSAKGKFFSELFDDKDKKFANDYEFNNQVLAAILEKYPELKNGWKVNALLYEFGKEFKGTPWSKSTRSSKSSGSGDSSVKYDEYRKLAKQYKNVIFHGAPGTGKTHLAMAIAQSGEDDKKYKIVQFHPSYDYTDFVEGIRPIQREGSDEVEFAKLDGHFKAFCRQVVEKNGEEDPTGKESKDNYYFIIDEINRADLSKVFGELLFGIEKDKRGVTFKTQYQNLSTYLPNGTELGSDVFKGGFFIPHNVIIIGTMNDIDRSVQSMDFALRRRFHFKEISFDEDALNKILKDKGAKGSVIKYIENFVDNFNKNIITDRCGKYGLDNHYYITQGQFTGLPDSIYCSLVEDSDKKADPQKFLEEVLRLRIKPLLREYLRGQSKERIDNILNAVVVKDLIKNRKR